MKRNVPLLFYISIILLFSIILTITHFLIFDYSGFLTFAENNLTDDGVIDYPARSVVRLYGFFCFSLILLFAIKYIKPSFQAIYDKKLIFCYSITGIILITHFLWFDNIILFFEDGIMEYLTVILALSSSTLFILSCRGKRNQSRKMLILMSFLLFFFALEEISWGQRLFGWETPEILKQINYQREMNIHNMFNFIFPLLYVLFFSMISLLFFFREKILKLIDTRSGFEELKSLIPGRQYYYFGFIFLFLAGYSLLRGGEITEEIFSVFIFFYSIETFNHRKILTTK